MSMFIVNFSIFHYQGYEHGVTLDQLLLCVLCTKNDFICIHATDYNSGLTYLFYIIIALCSLVMSPKLSLFQSARLCSNVLSGWEHCHLGTMPSIVWSMFVAVNKHTMDNRSFCTGKLLIYKSLQAAASTHSSWIHSTSLYYKDNKKLGYLGIPS